MHTYKCICATVVLRILLQSNHIAQIPELFCSGSQTTQSLPLLPRHSPQWDQMIVYGAQKQMYLFALLQEYAST
jgi:hypothetical protein